jgi:hypothetical protein
MSEFEAIFSSESATSVFFLISTIGLSVMAAIAFGSWASGRRKRAPHAPAAGRASI